MYEEYLHSVFIVHKTFHCNLQQMMEVVCLFFNHSETVQPSVQWLITADHELRHTKYFAYGANQGWTLIHKLLDTEPSPIYN